MKNKSIHLSKEALRVLQDLLNGTEYERGRQFIERVILEWEERGRYPHLTEEDIYKLY